MLLPTRCRYILIYTRVLSFQIFLKRIFVMIYVSDLTCHFCFFWTKVLRVLQSISAAKERPVDKDWLQIEVKGEIMNCQLPYRIFIEMSLYIYIYIYIYICNLLSNCVPLQLAVWPHFNIWTSTAFCMTSFQPLNHCSMLCDLISTPEPLQLAVWPPINTWSTIACCVTSFQPLNRYSLLCDLLTS
jgi:hypothetical protein